MTTPVSHGYPDWVRQVAQADAVLDSYSFGPVGGITTKGRYFTGGFKYVGVQVSITGNPGFLSFLWYDSQTGGTLIGSQAVPFRNSETLSVSIPVQGPWLAVQYIATAGNITGNGLLWTIAGDSPSTAGPLAPKTLIASGTSILAGATRTDSSTEIMGGKAFFSADSSLATWVAILEAVDQTGATTGVARLSNLTIPGMYLLIPSTPMQIRSVNTTGGNGPIRCFLNSLGNG